MALRPGWLADILGYFGIVNSANADLPQRAKLKFGAGFTVADNAAEGRTDVSVDSASAFGGAYQTLSISTVTATLDADSGVNGKLANTLASGLLLNIVDPADGERGLIIVTNSVTAAEPAFRLNGSATNVVAPSFDGYWNTASAAVNVFEWTFDGVRLVAMHLCAIPSLGAPLTA